MREEIDLRIGDTMAVDASLQVGSVMEVVEVSGAAPLLKTETSQAQRGSEGETWRSRD